MRKASVAVLLAASLALPGCLLLAGAAIGAGVVHVAGDDTAEVVLETSRDAAFEASRDELTRRGLVSTSDPEAGVLEGEVGSSSVTITVKRETDSTVRVAVEARKNAGVSPDIDTAQKIATEIVKRTG